MQKKIILNLTCAVMFLLMLMQTTAYAEYRYTRPKFTEIFSTIPKNGVDFLSHSFDSDKWQGWSAIALTTSLLYYYDDKLYHGAQKIGRDLSISSGDKSKNMMTIGKVSLLRAPTDLGSLFYFFGDGWVTIGLGLGFTGVGLYSNDDKTLRVASELFQGLFLTGITTQVLKRTTGRETPMQATRPRGTWRFFPSISEFQKMTTKYDAFPSGHLATTMTTFMILSENYADQFWIKPVGITAMTLLSYEMVNNSVHWASDYPLALGIGYMIGKTIVENGREDTSMGKSIDQTPKTSWKFFPDLRSDSVGMAAFKSF